MTYNAGIFTPISGAAGADIIRDKIITDLVPVDDSPIDWPARHLVGIDQTPAPFHLAQELATDSTSRTVAMIAGTQSGKTGFGPWWLADEITRTGGGDHIVVTSSYPLFQLKLLPSMLEVFEGILGIGRYWAKDGIIEIRNPETLTFGANRSYETSKMWARIILRSANALSGLESATARSAWLDEAGQDEFTLRAWNAINRRLTLFRGRRLITTTLYNLGWLKEKVIDKAIAGGKIKEYTVGEAQLTHTQNDKAGICLLQFDSILNPAFSIEEFEAAAGDLDDADFAMFYRGRVAKLRGMIYDVLDETVHKIPAYEIPTSWPVVVGVDPVGAMTAAVGIAYNPELNRLEIFAEYEEPYGKTTAEHAGEIMTMVSGKNVYKWVGGGPSENQARLDWGAAGMPLIPPPFFDVWPQIIRVYSLLKPDKKNYKPPNMVIHDSCPHVWSALSSMRRKRDSKGNLTDQIENKDIWHLPDAVRYAIAWLTGSGETTTVTVSYNPIDI